MCGQCTVAQECLDFALDTNQDSGIWGGLSEEERRVIRRKRAAAMRGDRRLTQPGEPGPSTEHTLARAR